MIRKLFFFETATNKKGYDKLQSPEEMVIIDIPKPTKAIKVVYKNYSIVQKL
jgi:hypothetical protein